MAGNGGVYDSVENILAKLHVLRDSCTGVIHRVLWRRVEHEQPRCSL
jgi:hypothetical protein